MSLLSEIGEMLGNQVKGPTHKRRKHYRASNGKTKRNSSWNALALKHHEKQKFVHIKSLVGQYTDKVKQRIKEGTAGRPYTSLQRGKI